MPTKPPSKAWRKVSNDFAKMKAAAGGAGAPANRTARKVAAPLKKGMMGAAAGMKAGSMMVKPKPVGKKRSVPTPRKKS